MKSKIWRWTKWMVIGAFGALLLSLSAGPAAAIICDDCDPDEGGGTPPQPPPPPSCNYDQQTSTSVGSVLGPLGYRLSVQRATVKTSPAGSCSDVCPNASDKWQGPGYCDCYQDTIPQLRTAGVETWEIHRTRYAIWSPSSLTVANTRTLLIALAGQNGLSSGGVLGGGPGNTTGQPNHWLDKCNDQHCGAQVFHANSFVGRLLYYAPFMNINPNNTFAVSFLDHQYDWNSKYRAKIQQGLFQWLKTKVDPTYLKQIIIAGHSRGACLALGLIKEFRDDPAFNAVKILGSPIDGTCQDGENGTLAWFNDIDNPLPGSPWLWYAWKSTFSLANTQKVCIQNTVGGEPQAGPANVHSFYLTNSAWNNSWVNIPHAICGQCFEDGVKSISNGECTWGGDHNVRTDVLDRALRFVEMNRVP